MKQNLRDTVSLQKRSFRRDSVFYTPYTFSAKERDLETGYSYFGARYYNATLSVWLSVDPLSDKYPSMSAFMYCAGNPVMMVDPDGREISIFYTNWRGKEKSLVYKPGMRTFGRHSFVKQTIKALDLIRDVANYDGGNKIDDLVKSKITTQIRERSGLGPDNIYTGNYMNEISWNPYKVDDFGEGNLQTAICGLAHELEHGHKNMTLLEIAYETDSDHDWVAVKDFQHLSAPFSDATAWLVEELRAINGLENDIAKKLNQYQRTEYIPPLRSYYSSDFLSTKEVIIDK